MTMGISCPQLSDEPSYIMVEPSGGGSCRCTCQDDIPDQTSCCSPHVFTSILLGILSCVLMTGGVFLAFHKWDPMWLMVSGIGVVLIIIGSVLHCCHNLSQRRMRRPSAAGGKGCCPRAVPADHPGHVIMNNGSLSEQLLPLSNARSVSQLSLNMLPGYFPPVVTAYGIEQHSAVVQNINRLVQQQQQQSQANGSCSPGVASNSGKSFIVLSLPGDTSAANIQNLVATVYQLDGNPSDSNTETNPGVPPPVAIIKPNPVPSVLKNAEVQTCNLWPAQSATANGAASTSAENAVAGASSFSESCAPQTIQPHASGTSSGGTQTDNLQTSSVVNLMDCSVDAASMCDMTPTITRDTQSPDHNHNNSALMNTHSSSSSDITESSPSVPSTSTADESPSVLLDIPETQQSDSEPAPSTSLLVDVTDDSSNNNVLIDISVNPAGDDSNCNNSSQHPILEDLMNTVIQQVDAVAMNLNNARIPNEITLLELPTDAPDSFINESGAGRLSSSSSNVSVNDADEVDDGELMDRSSPPPSYDDVTLEGEAAGAFGLAYGTI